MAVNKALKYSPEVVERFQTTSLTEPAVGKDYDWTGVDTIKLYSVDTVAMNNYSRAGDDRYGALNDVGTTLQTLTLARDRSFTTVIDRRNTAEQQNVLKPGTFLARQLKEVIQPEIDTYRLAALNTAADANGKDDVVADAATTSSNAYTNLVSLNASLDDDLVPSNGRVGFTTAAYIAALKQSTHILNAGDAAYKDRKSGDVGMVDGVRLIVVPASYMPSNTDFILTHPSALVSPMVLTDYVTHENPRGINGWVVEGRIVYDAFVLTPHVDAVAVHRTA